MINEPRMQANIKHHHDWIYDTKSNDKLKHEQKLHKPIASKYFELLNQKNIHTKINKE